MIRICNNFQSLKKLPRSVSFCFVFLLGVSSFWFSARSQINIALWLAVILLLFLFFFGMLCRSWGGKNKKVHSRWVHKIVFFSGFAFTLFPLFRILSLNRHKHCIIPRHSRPFLDFTDNFLWANFHTEQNTFPRNNQKNRKTKGNLLYRDLWVMFLISRLTAPPPAFVMDTKCCCLG